MRFPKMILFDYGHTLICESNYSTLRGTQELFRYIRKNQSGCTPEEIDHFAIKLWAEVHEPAIRRQIEVSEISFMRLLYGIFGIEFSISWEKAEEVFWNHTCDPKIMPNSDQMLRDIALLGIRTGVISNISFSGGLLADRINQLLPENHFEFVLASSDYGVRKPNRYLFEIALKKAELAPEEVWFCGDNVSADIEGALAVGIFPVWYENSMEENCFADRSGKIPSGDHLYIEEWNEMIDILQDLKGDAFSHEK